MSFGAASGVAEAGVWEVVDDMAVMLFESIHKAWRPTPSKAVTVPYDSEEAKIRWKIFGRESRMSWSLP